MSRKTYDGLVWGLLLAGVAVTLYLLSGCASNDPIPPIQPYRAAYGFPSTY